MKIISQKIIQLFYSQNITKQNYITLKEKIYNILKYNLNIVKFYKNLMDFLIKDNKIRDKTKYKIIKLLSDSQYDFVQSYRTIIILESFLINLYLLIKDDLL